MPGGREALALRDFEKGLEIGGKKGRLIPTRKVENA